MKYTTGAMGPHKRKAAGWHQRRALGALGLEVRAEVEVEQDVKERVIERSIGVID